MFMGLIIAIVDLFKHGIQQRHVSLLPFDGVGEEAVSSVRDELVYRHLLHSQNDSRLADVFLDFRPGFLVRLSIKTELEFLVIKIGATRYQITVAFKII